MDIKCYSVDLDDQHVVIDIDAYLATLTPTTRTVNAPLLWGADVLTLTLSGDVTTYGYMVADGHYYFARPDKVTPNAVTYTLTIDRWTRAIKRGAFIRSGRLVSGHVLPEFSDFGFDLPVQPNPYAMWNASTVFYNDTRYVVLASATLAPAHSGGPQRPVLIASEAFVLPSEMKKLRAAVGNMSRATKVSLNTGSGDNEIMSFAQMWLVPASIAVASAIVDGQPVIPEPNAVLTIDDTAYKTVNCYWYSTGWYDITRRTRYNSFAIATDGSAPRLTVNYFGNFANNIELPFAGQKTSYPVVLSSLNWTAGTFSMVAEIGDQRVPLDTSLELSFTATRKDQRDVDLMINDTITAVTSVLGIAGGIATGNALVAAGGVVGLGAGVAKAATRQNRHSTAARGNALASFLTSSMGAEMFVGACGLIRFSLTNEDEVMSALKRVGYVGGADVIGQRIEWLGVSSKFIDGHYDGTYVKFDDVVLKNDGQDPNDVAAVRDMLTNGVTIYRDVTKVGQPLDPLYIFDVNEELE